MWESTSVVVRLLSCASAINAPPTMYSSPRWSCARSFSFRRPKSACSRSLVSCPDMAVSTSFVEASGVDEDIVPDERRRRVGQGGSPRDVQLAGRPRPREEPSGPLGPRGDAASVRRARVLDCRRDHRVPYGSGQAGFLPDQDLAQVVVAAVVLPEQPFDDDPLEACRRSTRSSVVHQLLEHPRASFRPPQGWASRNHSRCCCSCGCHPSVTSACLWSALFCGSSYPEPSPSRAAPAPVHGPSVQVVEQHQQRVVITDAERPQTSRRFGLADPLQ